MQGMEKTGQGGGNAPMLYDCKRRMEKTGQGASPFSCRGWRKRGQGEGKLPMWCEGWKRGADRHEMMQKGDEAPMRREVADSRRYSAGPPFTTSKIFPWRL